MYVQARLAGHTAQVVQQPAAGGWKLQPAALEAALEGRAGPHLLVLTNPGNPSGCSYTRQELQALVPVFRSLHCFSYSLDSISSSLCFTSCLVSRLFSFSLFVSFFMLVVSHILLPVLPQTAPSDSAE
jgi:hypothetical protein